MKWRLTYKKVFAAFIALLLTVVIDSAYADVGGICAEGIDNYNHNYSLTGDGAHNIVAVAQAQVGRTNDTFQYHYGGWCAAFINDCAYLAGQASAIPFIHYQTHGVSGLRNAILNCGGYEVSSPQAGDIVFYWCTTDNSWVHVGLMEDGSSTIQGNVDDMCKRMSSPWNYRDVHGACYSVSYVRPNYAPTIGTIDVNTILDGTDTGAGTVLNGVRYGTFDIYINGSLKGNDVDDIGPTQCTSYEIKDIKPTKGHIYNGSVGNLSGSVAAGQAITVKLKFDTCNNHTYGNPVITKEATFTEQGTKTYTCTKCGFTRTESIPIREDWKLSGEWQEYAYIPQGVTSETCDIQYKNHYEQRSSTSPGNGWTKVAGSEVTTYENSGPIETDCILRQTSDTYVLVDWLYYHYCGSNGRVNYYQSSEYPTFHSNSKDAFDAVEEIGDDDSDAIRVYKLRWKYDSPIYAGALATCATGQSCWWYRAYQYQPRVAVTTYNWEKDSDWTTERDANANSGICRFRLKSFSVTYNANGGEPTPMAQTKLCTVDLKLTETIPEKAGWNFTGWNTIANGSGTAYASGDVYTEDASVTLYAQWTPMAVLQLPVGITHIEKESFANIGAYIIIIPDGCKSIGDGAFANNNELVQIYIPASVTSIAFDAFEGCSKMTIYAPENSRAIQMAKALQLPYEIVTDQ